jgi:hypothetical protein
MWTSEDGDSLFEEGWIDLAEGVRGNSVGKAVPVVELSFQETRSGGSYEWHQDPVPRFVITLSGTLEFQDEIGCDVHHPPGRRPARAGQQRHRSQVEANRRRSVAPGLRRLRQRSRPWLQAGEHRGARINTTA